MIEFIRNSARAHNEDNVDSLEFFGVPKGHLTHRGQAEAARLGRRHRAEFRDQKRFTAVKFNPNAFL